MIYLKEKLKIIFNRLSTILAIFKRMCVIKLNDIPLKIDEVVVGTNKLRAYLDGVTEYEIDESDINYLSLISSSMFSGRYNLTSVTIPDSVTSIGDRAFENCTSLASVTIGNGTTSIGKNAFYGCRSLTSVIIGNGVTNIGEFAFSYSWNADVYLNSTTPPILSNYSVFERTITIHVPIGSGDAYKSATNWSSYASQIVEDIQPS